MKLKHILLQGGAAKRAPWIPIGYEARLQVDDTMAVRDIEAGRRISNETVRRASVRLLERAGGEPGL